MKLRPVWRHLRTGFLLLAGLSGAAVMAISALTPWMDRWGASDEELAASYPGDELVPAAAGITNRAITIQAAPQQIYPWLVQIGADRGGWYSYAWLESLLNCPITNADRIHPEWQHLAVGDLVKMCPNEPAPPPYIVAQIIANRAIVMGHKENDRWVEAWQFILIAQADGSTRLVVRNRTMMSGGFWKVIHPAIFIMERGMLLGIKQRAEATAQGV